MEVWLLHWSSLSTFIIILHNFGALYQMQGNSMCSWISAIQQGHDQVYISRNWRYNLPEALLEILLLGKPIGCYCTLHHATNRSMTLSSGNTWGWLFSFSGVSFLHLQAQFISMFLELLDIKLSSEPLENLLQGPCG